MERRCCRDRNLCFYDFTAFYDRHHPQLQPVGGPFVSHGTPRFLYCDHLRGQPPAWGRGLYLPNVHSSTRTHARTPPPTQGVGGRWWWFARKTCLWRWACVNMAGKS